MAQFRIVRVPLLASGIAYLRWGPIYRRRDVWSPTWSPPAMLKAIADEYAPPPPAARLRILPNVFCRDTQPPRPSKRLREFGFQPGTAVGPLSHHPRDLARARAHPQTPRPEMAQPAQWRRTQRRSTLREGSGDSPVAEFTAIYRAFPPANNLKPPSISTNSPYPARPARGAKMRVLLCEKGAPCWPGLLGPLRGHRRYLPGRHQF